MRATRVVVETPPMLGEIVRRALAGASDVEVVEALASGLGGEDVLIIAPGGSGVQRWCGRLIDGGRLPALLITDEGRVTVLCRSLGELDPAGLLAAVRRAVGDWR